MTIKNKKNITISFIILIALLIAGFVILNNVYFQNNKSNSRKKYPTIVTTTKVRQALVNKTIDALGTTVAAESVILSPNVTEIVDKIFFNDGDFVKKGEVIVLLSSKEEYAKLARANAELKNTKKNFDRTAILSNRNHISQSEHDNSEASYDSAKATVSEIKSTITDRKIVAPFSGYLGLRQISPGTLVQPGTPIATLDMIEPIKVDFTLPEKYLSAIKKGQEVIATSVAYPNRQFHGKISAINSRIDTSTRAFTTRALFSNKDHQLKPGLLLRIKIILQKYKASVIPEHATVMRHGKPTVFVLQPGNTVTQRTVELGDPTHSNVVVKNLKPGDIIIVDGGFKLRDGQTVSTKQQGS